MKIVVFVIYIILYLLKVKENGLLREEQVQVLDLKNELVKLRGVKQSSTVMSNQIIELEDKIVLLTNQLENEKKEKDKISLDKENIKKEEDEVNFCFCYSRTCLMGTRFRSSNMW